MNLKVMLFGEIDPEMINKRDTGAKYSSISFIYFIKKGRNRVTLKEKLTYQWVKFKKIIYNNCQKWFNSI